MSTPDRISDLREFIASKLPELFDSARDQINEAINAAVEDAQDNPDKAAILSLSIGVKWDLGGNSVVVSMPVAVRRKYEAVGTLDDPSQPKLPNMESEE